MWIGATCRDNSLNDVVHDATVQIVTPETGISIGRENLKNPCVQFEYREFEGASTQIVDSNSGFLLQAIQPVSEGSRRGLVDDSFNGQPGEFTCRFCRRSLGVIEVGRNGNHRSIDIFTKCPGCILL